MSDVCVDREKKVLGLGNIILKNNNSRNVETAIG
jgi:hypothetical protein